MLRHRLRASLPARRLSDAERERAVHALSAHYADGRFTTEELEGRVESVYRSRTQHDLAAHVRDLPLRGASELIVGGVRHVQRAVLRMHVLTYLAINALIVAIWALTGEGAFWPALVLVPSSAVLAWHVVASRALTRALTRLRW